MFTPPRDVRRFKQTRTEYAVGWPTSSHTAEPSRVDAAAQHDKLMDVHRNAGNRQRMVWVTSCAAGG
jgi:hypothetical protein